jgi:hypothetical protein
VCSRIARQVRDITGFSEQEVYLYHRVADEALAASPPPAGVHWTVVTATDRENVLGAMGELPSDLRRRAARGDKCYIAFADGRPAHYSWVQLRGLHVISDAGRPWPVPSGQFMIYHCGTAAWARGRGLYPATLLRIVEDQFLARREAGWIYTTRDNVASQRGIAKAGFREVRAFRSLQLGRVRLPLPGRPQGR